MRTPVFTKRFAKDLKRFNKNIKILSKFKEISQIILNGKKLHASCCNHKLKGKWKNCWECHIFPDVLLVYEISELNNKILFYRIGSHSDLFS